MASKKNLAIGCFVVFGVLFIGCVFAFLIWAGMASQKFNQDHEKWAMEYSKKRTAETVGTITDYKESRIGKSYTYSVTFDFEVDGKKYSKTATVGDGHPVKYGKGKQGKVCYDPKDMENAIYRDKADNYVCPKPQP